MSTAFRAAERSKPRRRDRTVEDSEWIKSFLKKAALGVLATQAEGQPFVHSNIFAYDEARHAIYFHTAKTGRTRSNIDSGAGSGADEGTPVCFHTFEMGRLLPASTALEFSVEYAGVTVFGRVQVVADREEATYGLQLLLDKYFSHLRPGEHYRPITSEELARTSVFRLDIEEWSAKRKAVDADFPGAFFYQR